MKKNFWPLPMNEIIKLNITNLARKRWPSIILAMLLFWSTLLVLEQTNELDDSEQIHTLLSGGWQKVANKTSLPSTLQERASFYECSSAEASMELYYSKDGHIFTAPILASTKAELILSSELTCEQENYPSFAEEI